MVLLSELSEESSSSSSTHVHSSSTRSHSSSTDGHRYDVFLSFRGVDTRHSFTDHLHKALIDANITTFLDDEEIETGEDLKPELESAIKASRASIIVLSKNYASSTWCLDELALILEKRVTSAHIVIPIFYHVEPTHVRKQQSSFGDAMTKHKQTMEAETNADKRSQWADKMDRWTKVLIEVSNLKGKDVKGSSLVSLSLRKNNLSNEFFPMDLSSLSMLRELYLDENPIVSMPNCVRTLPRLELLSMKKCRKLKSVEHPPHTLRTLVLHTLGKRFIKKVVFDPEMFPLKFYFSRYQTTGSYEIEGMLKIQPMDVVEEKVFCSLGWTDIDFLNNRRTGTNGWGSKIQIVYEFGIFSMMYGLEEMPSWFKHRSVGPSISFTIPSSPNNLRGLNFCSVHTLDWHDEMWQYEPPMIKIINITKNRTWIYERHRDFCSECPNCFTLLSHWMFGKNEMEVGDHVTITGIKTMHSEVIKECGVSLVYDDGKMDEEDVLGYYKSWNHIIGGDLSPFQTTTGEYILDHRQFLWPLNNKLRSQHRKYVGDGASYQEKKEMWFKALSQRKPGIVGHTHEGKGGSSRSHPSHENS